MTKRKSVLLVDADNRKADLTKGFGLPIQPGLTELLSGRALYPDIVRKGPVEGVSIIPCGSLVSEPADLLAGDAFRDFVFEARRNFDTILFDTPPILPVADTMSMKEQLDGFIFVLRLGYTPIEMFTQATEEIGGNKILGVVLNGANPKSHRFYGKYYGHYYTSPGNTETRK
jgi:capsular exopolysaccharide synthesis family protein